ncbi:unnamed protein product [Sphagnum jensenii]|uniref:Uncharacterized protein n=1 Tax=Sphagnum jensenii TaxID=128206 RepID=A0ABP0WPF0_9BRYO
MGQDYKEKESHNLLRKIEDLELARQQLEEGASSSADDLQQLCVEMDHAAINENLDKTVLLETELAEAIEAKNMYKAQLQSALAQQHNNQAAVQQGIGNMDHLIQLQKQSKSLETEVWETPEHFSSMSLHFGELEAQHEEHMMTV